MEICIMGEFPFSTKKCKKIVIGGAIQNCVHIAGIYEYLKIAEKFGYHTIFLGSSVHINNFIHAIEQNNPDIICISYRLTSSGLEEILSRFFKKLEEKDLILGRTYYFGGTPSCIEIAKKFPQFSYFFQGEEPFYVISNSLSLQSNKYFNAQKVCERLPIEHKNLSLGEIKQIIKEERYFPMIRHHFGLPSLDDTIEGIKKIANSGLVDVISIGPDQNAQEFFFEPEKMDPSLNGTGGVPLRSEDDLNKIWEATQLGNFPRLRIYAGTQNLQKWAEMSVRILNNAWGTIPLFWYSILDGRSTRPLDKAIRENMDVIKWYAKRGIPVEINEAHQWSLRDTSDSIAVAIFFLAAYNAKKLGVKIYISQFMFNNPKLTSGKMDLAKMLAKLELISQLEDENFLCLREVRSGLTHFSIDQNIAKGQLASSILLALALKPQIIHVVSFSEADHAATADDVIESCKIVRGVLKNSLKDFPDMAHDKDVINRKNFLIKEAQEILNKIREVFSNEADDPLSDPHSLELAVKLGILDAPQLINNSIALGKIHTMVINGGINSVDNLGNVISESNRINLLLKNNSTYNKLLKEVK